MKCRGSKKKYKQKTMESNEEKIHSIIEKEKKNILRNIEEMYNKIQNDIEKTLERFINDMEMLEMCKYAMAGAKYFRTIIGYSLLNEEMYRNDSYRILLTIPEYIHNASLIIDDIMDEDKMRRDKPSFYKRYNKNKSYITTFMLHNITFKILYENKELNVINIQKIIQEMLNNESLLIEGQYKDLYKKKNITIQEYEKVVAYKTSTLYQLVFFIGMYLKNVEEMNDEKYKESMEIGKSFGIMFQIYDDYTDAYQDKITGSLNIVNQKGIYESKELYIRHKQIVNRIMYKYKLNNYYLTSVIKYMDNVINKLEVIYE